VVAEVALGVVAQRLARRLCPACSGPARARPRQARLFGGLLEGVPLRGAAGCEACKGTGYRGRLGLFEVLVFDERLLDDIMSDRPGHEVRDELRRRGHINLVQDGLRRLRAGDTSLDELTRVLPFRAIEAERTFAEQNGGRVG